MSKSCRERQGRFSEGLIDRENGMNDFDDNVFSTFTASDRSP